VNRGELIERTRDILQDKNVPPLTSDDDIGKHLGDAVDEVHLRTRVMQDSRSKFCTIQLLAGVSQYKLDPSIFAVRRAKIVGQLDPLHLWDVADMDRYFPGWDDPTLACSAIPEAATFGHDSGRFTVAPTPDTTYTLKLLVWRGTLDCERMTKNSDCPELPVHMHRELKHWAAGMILNNQDGELFDPAGAAKQFALFTAAYGDKPDLNDVRSWSTNRRRRVRAHFD
jgi:hypothetical protein